MIYGSTFSGIGGLDAGLHRAGLTVKFLCEKDTWRRSILAARFPGVPVFDDVHRVGLRPETGRPVHAGDGGISYAGIEGGKRGPADLDLLVGGFPCTDLSVAGKRAGLAGARSGLFYEFARIAGELVRPGGYVLVENVPGLFSSHGGRDFASVLGTLADLGFHDLAWRVLDSQFFGVPQRRRRVFILARRARGRRCAEILLEPESRGGNPPTRRQTREGVAGTLGGGAAGSSKSTYSTDRMTRRGGADVAPTLDANMNRKFGSNQWTDNGFAIVPALTSKMAKGTGGPAGDECQNLVTDPVYSLGSHSGSADADVSNRSHASGGPTGMGITEGRANSLRNGRTQAIGGQSSGVRRLTPTECERLQGLPDGWTLPGPDSRRYAGLGDAVTANCAEWIGKRLLAAEERMTIGHNTIRMAR